MNSPLRTSGPAALVAHRRLTAAAILALACLTAAPAADASDRGQDYCFPQQQLALGGLHYRDPKATVDRLLGRPIASQSRIVPGTAGAYRVTRRRYRDLWLDLKVPTQEVETLEATGPRAEMPNGVRVGSTLADVSRRLRVDIKRQLSEDLVWTPPLCEQGPYDRIFVGPLFYFKHDGGEVRLHVIKIQRI